MIKNPVKFVILVIILCFSKISAQDWSLELSNLQPITNENANQLTEFGDPIFQSEKPIRAIEFSYNGDLLFFGSWFGNHIIISLSNFETVANLQLEIPLCDAVFSPDDSLIVLSSLDGSIYVYDIANEEMIITASNNYEPHQLDCPSISFSESRLAYTDNNIVFLWDFIESGQPISLDIVGDRLLFNPDGDYLAITKSSGNIEIWDVSTLELNMTLTGNNRAINSLIFTLDGINLISADIFDANGRPNLTLWELETEQSIQILEVAGAVNDIDNLTISNDGSLIAFHDPYQTSVLDINNWEIVAEFPNNIHPTSNLFSTDDSLLFISTLGSTVETWNFVTNQVYSSRFFDFQSGCWSNDLAIDTDGTLLAVGDECGNVRLLRIVE